MEIISAFNFPPSANLGVMHFLPAHWSKRKKYIDLGFYVSFSGVITFPPKKGELVGTYDKIIKNIPLEKNAYRNRLPVCRPSSASGKRNEPQYVKYVAQKIAEIKGLSFDEVAEQTTKNARELFGIKGYL